MDLYETNLPTDITHTRRLRDKTSVIAGATQHSAVYPTIPTSVQNTLISFLSYIKTHGIPILPVSMPDVRTVLGFGASFFVNGAEMPEDYEDPVTGASLSQGKIVAVKRPIQQPNMRDPMADRIRVAFIELITTNHPPLRAHPNIVNLLGVGFEIGGPKENSPAMPMLIPEIAELGNLAEVLETAAQEEHPLTFEQKMSLCIDVLHGLEILHACDIIHGDVKCENMLVFDKEDEVFHYGSPATSLTCKLTDFGVWLKGGGAWVYGSRPWQAPECSRPAFFKTEEAKRTDIYSFGMLLWRVALDGDPFNTLGELEGSTSKERRDNRNRKIASLKDSDGLVDHVYQSLASSDSFTRPQLEMLCEVVSVTLVKEPRQRELDVTRLIRLLSKDQWYEARHPVAPARIPVSIDSQFLDMEKWYHEFARISPVVHSLIVSGFLSTVHSPSSADEDTLTESRLYASYQLAVCYANGTGVSFSPKDCLKWLEFAANNGSEQARKAHSKIAESFALPPLVLTYPSADSPDSSNPNSPFEPISLTEASRETSASHINKGMNVNGDDLEPGKLQDHLLEAAEGCQYTTMSALISAGVKPGISQDGVTPLHFSSSWDISEAIKLIPQFTKAGSDINAAAKRGPTLGGTPLMWSVFEDCIEISRLLVENGANPLHCDDRGENALHVAARTHSASHLRMLLAHVRPVDVHTHFSKLVEVALGGTSRFARLVRHGKQSKANADEILGLLKDWSVFYSGPEFFVPVLISSLESSVACVYAAMNTDLQMTAIHAHKIEPSLLVNILNESILRFNKGLFNALLDYGVPVTTTFRFQKSLLHSCARIPDHSVAASEFAPRILAQGGNVHSRDENGLTPWMDAVLQRKWDLADLLLNEGSDAFATDNEGFNVLGLCIKNINAGSLGYVMKYNVQVKRSKEDFHKRCFMVNEKLGISALQLAASKRLPRAHGMKREVLGVFLHCLTDYSNDHSQLHHRSSGLLSDLLTDATALDIAATLGYVHIVKALVKNGAHHDGDGPRASRHAKAALERSSSLVDSQERMNLERCIFIIDNWDSDTTGTRKIADYWTSLKTLDESERRVSWAIIADHQDGP